MNAPARVWACFSWAIATSLAFIVVPAASWAHDDPSKTTRLELSLDDSVYVQGQAILALVRFRNEGRDTLRDLAHMDPHLGYLQFRLRDSISGKMIPRVGFPALTSPAREGPSLSRHGVICQVVDLLTQFGNRPLERDEFLNLALAESSLPVGRYEISCTFNVRSGFNKHLGAFQVQSRTVSFRVVPARQSVSGERLLAALRRNAAWAPYRVGRQAQEQCRSHLAEALRSPYAYQVFQCAWPLLQGHGIDSLLAQEVGAGVSPVRSGALLWLACAWHENPARHGAAWLRARRAAARSQVERDILETWERRFARRG